MAHTRDGQGRRTGGLHDENETPKTAGQRIIAAGHRAAGLGLANGAGDLIHRPCAGSGATGNLKPVYGVRLRVEGWREQPQCQGERDDSQIDHNIRLLWLMPNCGRASH